mmetsp:Transcript_12511/g.35861  ORF Transcript_12511/g.35861 Transcript_12511/m.35861 type:complete len:237 (-) Transcript_12511:145-855(-)
MTPHMKTSNSADFTHCMSPWRKTRAIFKNRKIRKMRRKRSVRSALAFVGMPPEASMPPPRIIGASHWSMTPQTTIPRSNQFHHTTDTFPMRRAFWWYTAFKINSMQYHARNTWSNTLKANAYSRNLGAKTMLSKFKKTTTLHIAENRLPLTHAKLFGPGASGGAGGLNLYSSISSNIFARRASDSAMSASSGRVLPAYNRSRSSNVVRTASARCSNALTRSRNTFSSTGVAPSPSD